MRLSTAVRNDRGEAAARHTSTAIRATSTAACLSLGFQVSLLLIGHFLQSLLVFSPRSTHLQTLAIRASSVVSEQDGCAIRAGWLCDQSSTAVLGSEPAVCDQSRMAVRSEQHGCAIRASSVRSEQQCDVRSEQHGCAIRTSSVVSESAVATEASRGKSCWRVTCSREGVHQLRCVSW